MLLLCCRIEEKVRGEKRFRWTPATVLNPTCFDLKTAVTSLQSISPREKKRIRSYFNAIDHFKWTHQCTMVVSPYTSVVWVRCTGTELFYFGARSRDVLFRASFHCNDASDRNCIYSIITDAVKTRLRKLRFQHIEPAQPMIKYSYRKTGISIRHT